MSRKLHWMVWTAWTNHIQCLPDLENLWLIIRMSFSYRADLNRNLEKWYLRYDRDMWLMLHVGIFLHVYTSYHVETLVLRLEEL